METVGGRELAENRGSEIRDAASRATDDPAKFEETWKSWEHQVDVYENLSSSKLDDDVKISVVLREAPQKLRDHLLVNSQQFEENYNKLRAIIQAYLDTIKTWIVNDIRETDPMEVDYVSKSKSKGNRKGNSKDRNQRQRPRQEQIQKQRKTRQRQRVPLVRKEMSLRTRLLVTSQPRQDGERNRSRER